MQQTWSPKFGHPSILHLRLDRSTEMPNMLAKQRKETQNNQYVQTLGGGPQAENQKQGGPENPKARRHTAHHF